MAVLKPFEATRKEISADKHVSISKVIPLAKNHYSVWLVRLQKRTHPWFPTLVTRWDAASQISKALACWRYRPYWIPGWRNWRSVTRQPWDRQSSGLFRRCQGMSRLMIPMKIGSPVIQLKQLACGISSTQWPSNQRHKEPQPAMQHWKPESILKNQCWQDFKIPYCGGRRMSDTMNLSQKLRRSIFASLAERVFSKAGELVSMRRNRLKPKNVDMFLPLNKIIWDFSLPATI